ncbi:hypothetical protein KBC03_03045 [Patescibacteria group bacterium]|nr:hypothetical protein [Patescibacteria group bacterium]
MEKTSEQQETRVNDIKNSGKGNLLQKISKRIAKELHNKTVEDLREGFDGLFGK